jgi:tetratricopeptide (TPR) repeat protein
MRTIFALLLTGLVAIFVARQAFAANPAKIALVVGNANYPDHGVMLVDAANDAQDVAEELRHDGFIVENYANLATDAMRKALERFYDKIEQGSVALIFFDGFGIQSERQSYLLPVDAKIWTEPDASRNGFDLDAILDEMDHRGALIKIALIDASRRNPFERRFRRYSAGLAPVVAPINSLVLYSTAPGSVVTNSTNEHGLFVRELLREIRVPNVSAEQALTNTKAGVAKATNQGEVPWFSSSLTTEFAFAGKLVRPPWEMTDQTSALTHGQKPACEAPMPDPAPSLDELAKDAVIGDLTRRIAANDSDAARYKRGQLYAIKHAYALAVQDFDAAIRRNPRDAQALNNRCWVRAAIGDLQAALADCDRALQLNPGLPDTLDSRGLVNLKLGKTAEAVKDYSASIQGNPKSSSSLFGRGIATQRSGGDGSLDIAVAKSMDPNIAKEFARYGVTECVP